MQLPQPTPKAALRKQGDPTVAPLEHMDSNRRSVVAVACHDADGLSS